MKDEYEVLWSGTLHRQNELEYSLLGDGWQITEHVLSKAAPKRDEYPSAREVRKANLLPGDDIWRTYRPNGTPVPKCTKCGRRTVIGRTLCASCRQPAPVTTVCRGCGRKYKTRIPGRRRLCKACMGMPGRKAA